MLFGRLQFHNSKLVFMKMLFHVKVWQKKYKLHVFRATEFCESDKTNSETLSDDSYIDYLINVFNNQHVRLVWSDKIDIWMLIRLLRMIHHVHLADNAMDQTAYQWYVTMLVMTTWILKQFIQSHYQWFHVKTIFRCVP